MAERGWWPFGKKNAPQTDENPDISEIIRVGTLPASLSAVAGLEGLFEDTEPLRDHTRLWTKSDFDNEFDLYDQMLALDPELNGAVRSVSLTANNWEIDYTKGRNRFIRESIRELVEENVDFDDFLINTMRNLMVYGNDINKLVGKAGVGITDIQPIPIKQVTITDNREIPNSATENDPMMEPKTYRLREQGTNSFSWSADEVLHIRIDYRSNWFRDKLGRWTFGIWGASRFTSLKQPIRAKYNTINNKTALEDALTKQFVTINTEAVAHIQDPDEQRERLIYIMDQVAKLLEGLRGDQVPILPSYVEMHHVDLKNSVPDPTSFLESVNADISAVLHVPRSAAGQERGSTFAATYNASMWSVNAITRLQSVVLQAVQDLFLRHLNLAGFDVTQDDVPTLKFSDIAEENQSDIFGRAALGYSQGIITLNEAREVLDLPPTKDGGEEFKQEPTRPPFTQSPPEESGGGQEKPET